MKNVAQHIAFALFILCSPALAQPRTGAIEGKIIEEKTHQPVATVNVYVRGTVMGTVSDASGAFRLKNIPVGSYTVVFSLVGYETKSLSGIEVRANEIQELSVSIFPAPVQLEQVVVTASRREQALQEVPVSVSTVTAKMLADRVTVNLDDALRYVPGVNMMMDQVNIRGSTGYSRGVGSRVLVLLDGLPYVTGDTGEITWETLPMHQVERIEIVKGAGSALYGSSALGGVVNVITKDLGEKPEMRFRLFSGMYDKPRYSEWDWSGKRRWTTGGFLSYADHSGPLNYLVSVTRSVDESYRENDVYHRWNVFSKFRYNLSEVQNVDLVANFMHRTHGNFFWWKSLREATRPADAQRDGNVEWNRGNLSAAYKEFVSNEFFYTVKGIYYGNFWRDDSSGRVNNVSASHVAQVEGQGVLQVSPSNIFTFGGTTNYDQVSSNIFGDHPGMGFAVYVQNELTIDRGLKLTSGFRYDWQQVSALPSGEQLNPKIGLVYAPNKSTTLRASLGTGFRYPSISELYTAVTTGVSQINIVPNPDLKAERSTSYEIGGSQILFQQVYLEAAVFQNDFSNLIEGGVDLARLAIQFRNVTKARIRGIESGLRAEWFDKLLLTDFSYTFTDPQDLSDPSNVSVLKFRPRHLFYSSAVVNYDEFRTSFDYRFISRVEAIDENLVRLAPIVQGENRVPIHVFDARISYDLVGLGVPFRVGFNVNNVLNYQYVELIGNLAPVRTYLLSVEGIF